MHKIHTWLVIGLILTLAGCDLAQQSPRQSGRVALIDIVRVSLESGHTDQINNKITEAQAGFQDELNKLQTELQSQISETQQKFGTEEPTDEQRQELSGMINSAQQEFQAAKANATQELKKLQFELINEFRAKLQPVASQVANDRGMSVVLINNEAYILDYDAASDITDAVIAKLPKVAVAPAMESGEPAMENSEGTMPAEETVETESKE